MGKKQERLNQLISVLQNQPKLSVKELAARFSVSEMTIRRDLAFLESSSLLDMTPQVNPAASFAAGIGFPFTETTENSPFLKIGRAAAALVEPEDILIVDSGMAAACLCSFIPSSIHVTVLCYDYTILTILRAKPNITVILCGGSFHPESNCFLSREGLETLRHHRAAKVFLTADGLHPDLGATCSMEYLAPLKREAVSSAACRILLADSSVFDKIRPSLILPLSDVDILVTEQVPGEKWSVRLEELGVRVFVN